MASKLLTVVDLFSGAGGLSTGFLAEGFRVLVASDYSEVCRRTYLRNHPGVPFVKGDLSDPRKRREVIARAIGADVVCGGPPCVGHSSNGAQDLRDYRAWLWVPYLQVVEKVAPKWVVMEAVRGILGLKGGKHKPYEAVVRRFNSIGYHVHHRLLVASSYGVPQERARVIFLACRDGFALPEFPTPSKGKPPTVRQAIGDLADLPDDPEFNHVRAKHGASRLAKIAVQPQGKVTNPLARFAQANWRLISDVPSRTVTTANPFIHPWRHRACTNRELARLQGFDDSFRFVGNDAEVRMQVGNAVPPPFAAAIARSVVAASRDQNSRVGILPAVDDFERRADEVLHLLGNERKHHVKSNQYALAIGHALEAVGKKYGEGRLRKFFARVGLAKTSGDRYRSFARAARTEGMLNSFPHLSRAYWTALAGFVKPGDTFGWSAFLDLLRFPLTANDGTPDAGKLGRALSAFKRIRKKVAGNLYCGRRSAPVPPSAYRGRANVVIALPDDLLPEWGRAFDEFISALDEFGVVVAGLSGAKERTTDYVVVKQIWDGPFDFDHYEYRTMRRTRVAIVPPPATAPRVTASVLADLLELLDEVGKVPVWRKRARRLRATLSA